MLAIIIAWPVLSRPGQVMASPGGQGLSVPNAPAAPNVFASPIQAGCYIAAPSDCRIHVEPFTINLNTGSHIVKFLLVTIRAGGPLSTIYDWRPDTANAVSTPGDVYTPSLVAQDFGAVCGASYQVVLEGQDSVDTNVFSLGTTGQFTCPSTLP